MELARAQAVFEQTAYTGVRPKRAGDETYTISLMDAKQFDGQDDSFARALKTLMAMVCLVLLVAMSNVVMLLMARNSSRQGECQYTARARRRPPRDGAAATNGEHVACHFGRRHRMGVRAGATRALGLWARIESNLQPDGTVLCFTLSVLFVLALAFGLAPLRVAMSSGAEMTLRSSATVSQSSSRKMRVGNAVIVTQIAMCVVLLVGAGLLLGTLGNLLNTPLGQKPEGLLVFGVHPQHANSEKESIAFFVALQQRLRTIPGVDTVSTVANRPGSGWSNSNSGLLVDGHKPSGIEPEQASFRGNTVGPDYFRTMGVQVLQGRDFSDADSTSAPKILIVNETFAKKYVGTSNAVGHVISDTKGVEQDRIVGVVKDHKYTGITEETRPKLWTVFTQGGAVNGLNVEMRVSGDPMAMLPTVRKVIAQIDPDIPLLEPMSQSAVFEQSISQQVLFARLSGCFAVLTVVLIATGLYGTLAYRVSRRSAEIGVRMALGAQRSQVVWMVLRRSLLLCVVGVALGVPFAMAAGKGLESSLYGMKPLDVASYVFAIAGVALVALLASAIPAGRAANVNPTSALRME